MNSESIRKVRRSRSIRHKFQPILLFASIAILLFSSACHFPRVDVQATATFLSARQTLVAQQLTPGSVVSTPENHITPQSTQTTQNPQPTIPPLETPLPITPAPERVCELDLLPGNMLYCSQSGDRLETVARRFRLSEPSQIQGSEGFAVDMLLPVNTPLGVPTPTFYVTHTEKIFPDSEVLYGPDAASSDIIAYASQAVYGPET